MKRLLTAVILALALALRAGAQAVVIDPSQIAASAINVADQIDYAIDQISELTNMGDKLGNLKGHLDNVFGEDGIGGKAITLMQDLGTLERLTKVYNSTLQTTLQYAERLKTSGNFRVSDVNAMLAYLNSSKQTAELAVQTAKKILSSLGLSKGEKKDELDDMIKELEEELKKTDDVMEIEMESSLMAEGLIDFVNVIDNETSVQSFVEARQEYGEKKSAAGKTLGLISVILMLLGIVSCAYGYVVYLRGGIAGDPTAQNIFIRIGVALFACIFILNLISSVFNLTL